MPSEKYPFLQLPGRPPGPYLPLVVGNPENTDIVPMWGLLDTGADHCVFPRWLATRLGHDLKADPVETAEMGGIGSRRETVYFHTFRVALVSSDMRMIIRTKSNVKIGCIDRDDLPPLLGQADFLAGFRVTLDYRTATTTIEWKGRKKRRRKRKANKI